MASLRPDSALHPAGIFRTAPFPGEATSSPLRRLAHRYGREEKALRRAGSGATTRPGTRTRAREPMPTRY
jgi:hypothetical protein